MEKQITAIDWLIENMPNLGKYIQLGVSLELHAKFQQAKELEKQQIIGIYTDIKMKNHKLPYGMKYLNKLAKVEEDAEKYYNNNFKK